MKLKLLLVALLSGLFLPLFGQEDHNRKISWWVEADVNNSLHYSYAPPYLSSTNPNIPNRPVGAHSLSLFGGALSGGCSNKIRENFYFESGFQVLLHRNRTYLDVDSVQMYCDTAGVEIPYNINRMEIAAQLMFAGRFSINRLSFIFGTTIPVFISNQYKDTYFSGTHSFKSNQWIWDFSFPSLWLNLNVAYVFVPGFEIIGSYAWFTSNVFLYKRDFSLGVRYSFK